MKITDLQVDGFGVWNDLTVDGLSREMTVFFGRNEAGKTTLMQFIRSTLYGYTPDRRRRYLPPVFGGVGGGSLYVQNGDLRLQIQRHARPEADPLEGDLAVLSSQGHQYGHDYLARLLASVDETIFNNVFAIGLHEIQELASLDGTEAARELYKLASGVDRVSLIDVMSELEERRQELLAGKEPRDSARSASPESRHTTSETNKSEGNREVVGRILQLHRRRKEVQRRLEATLHQGRHWVSLIDRRRELEARLKDSKDELAGLEAQARILELANLCEPTVRRIRSLESELQILAKLPDERDVDLDKLARLDRRLQDLDRRIEQIAGEAEGVKRSAERLPLDRALWKQATRIEAVAEHRPWIESIERQIERNRSEIRDLEAELVEAGGSKKAEGNLDRAALAGLAGPGRALKARRREVEHARRDAATAEQEVTRLRAQLDESMAANSCESLGDSFHEAGRIVHLLRRRQDIDERVERLQTQRKVAEAELDETIQAQVFSPERLFVVGGFVVIGVALILGGWSPFLVRWLSPNPLMGFLGCGIVLAGMGLKKYWEYEAQDQVDRAKQTFDSVREELAKLKSERDELDRTLPQGFGRADGRLDDAQHRLAVIERLLPMEGRISEAAQQLEAAQERLARTERELESAERRWKQSLQALGVATDLTFSQVRQLAERGSQFERTRQRLADARRQLAQFEEDRASLMRRIIEIAEEAGLKSEAQDPIALLQRLETELRTQRGLMERRREFAQQYQELREKRTLVLRRQHRLKLFRTTMFSKVGAATEAEFRGFADKHKVRRERRVELETLQGKLKLQLGEQVDSARVLETIGRNDAKQLERDWEALQKKIEELRREQEKAHETRGELTAQIKQLADSDELEQAKLEAADIERQLAEATQRWQELAATTRVLESLREFYEAHRQPDTLRAASEHLGRMTGGRYTRLWTRMVGNELLVDGREGQGLSVDVLSRGTREAVFLALRLALVEIYRKRGIRLPMVLDDVLVNFDTERAHWAGEVLRDFAQQGHQVLMFTCHAHVSQLFQDLGCDVRVLPYHRDVVHRAATVVTKADEHLIVEELAAKPPTPSVEAEPMETIDRIERTIDEELRPAPQVPPRKKKKRRRPAPAAVAAPEPPPAPMPTRERQRRDAAELWWQEE